MYICICFGNQKKQICQPHRENHLYHRLYMYIPIITIRSDFTSHPHFFPTYMFVPHAINIWQELWKYLHFKQNKFLCLLFILGRHLSSFSVRVWHISQKQHWHEVGNVNIQITYLKGCFLPYVPVCQLLSVGYLTT